MCWSKPVLSAFNEGALRGAVPTEKYNLSCRFHNAMVLKESRPLTNTPRSMLIRDFRPDDLSQVLNLVNTTFRERYSPDLLMGAYRSYPEYALVVEHGGVIGFALGTRSGARDGRILIMAVRASHQNMGLGATLLNILLNRFLDHDLAAARLEVRVSNTDAIRLYRRYGFKIAGIIPLYYGDGEDGYVMQKALKPI